MILGWLRRRRRRRLLAAPFPESWRAWLRSLPFYRRLRDEERERLERITCVLVGEKRFEGVAGLEITDEMRVVICAQAALLLLGIEHDYYEDVTSILVFPTTYASPLPRRGAAGVVTEGALHQGEAWYRGPVVLAWDGARHGPVDPHDGHNLVLHEFAHRLDALDGFFDGTPPLRRLADYDTWKASMTRAFEDLRAAVDEGRETVLDAYGATDEAEFFAVATETFFEKPRELAREQPALYEVLRTYFGQDPLARLTVS